MKEWIWVNVVSVSAIWLLVDWVTINVLVWWGDLKVCCSKNEAVGRDLGPCVKNNDITHNEVPGTYGWESINFSSDDSDCVFFNERLQLNKLSILSPVSKWCNGNKSKCGQYNSYRFPNSLQRPISEHRGTWCDHSRNKEDQPKRFHNGLLNRVK